MGDNSIIRLENITVSFDGEQVLKNLNLSIRDGEFVTLLGPSGCGKTTTLRIIGGFVKPDAGDVFFNGKKINDLPPHKREVNTIFQKYALFPHLNVYDNVAFGMRVHKKSEKQVKETVREMLAMVNLSGFANRNVNSPFRRATAACCNCQGIGQRSESPSFGRTSGRSRLKAAQRYAGGTEKKFRKPPVLPLFLLPMTRKKRFP